MKQNVKIFKTDPGHYVGGFALMLIHKKINPFQDHDSKNDFTNDQANSRTVLILAKQN